MTGFLRFLSYDRRLLIYGVKMFVQFVTWGACGLGCQAHSFGFTVSADVVNVSIKFGDDLISIVGEQGTFSEGPRKTKLENVNRFNFLWQLKHMSILCSFWS